MVNIGNDWDGILAEEFQKDYYQNLRQFLAHEYKTQEIFPDMYHIYDAFKYTPYESVKCVILGQDPYPTPGCAHGMAFSVMPGVRHPRSLENIFRELKDDLGIDPPPKEYGYLMSWAKEGVLLLNTALTVRAGNSDSHRGRGWEVLTDRVIEILSAREKPMVFILWGRNARNKKPLIDTGRHLVVEGAHPSPLSAANGFFGGRYFSKTNDFLIGTGQEPIDWEVK